MSKTVLVISSSPRKGGNSELLCDQFVSGAQESGHQAEKISLRDLHINYCTGCGACMGGATGCDQNDDAADVLEKMVAADVIVMATPVYFYTMAAQMKTLIDRTCARYREMRNKEFYFIVTAADSSRPAMERTLDGFRAFTSLLPGAVEKGVVYGTGAWGVGEIKNSPAMEQAHKIGGRV